MSLKGDHLGLNGGHLAPSGGHPKSSGGQLARTSQNISPTACLPSIHLKPPRRPGTHLDSLGAQGGSPGTPLVAACAKWGSPEIQWGHLAPSGDHLESNGKQLARMPQIISVLACHPSHLLKPRRRPGAPLDPLGAQGWSPGTPWGAPCAKWGSPEIQWGAACADAA